MSASAMSYGLSAAALVMVVLRLRRLRTTDNPPAVRFSVLLVGAMALTFGVFAPTSQAWVNQYVGDLFKLIGNSSTLVGMFAASALVSCILHSPQQARRRILIRAALLATAIAVMVTMFALPHPVPLTGSFDGLYAIDPSLIVYTLVYATFFGATVAEMAWQFQRFARITGGTMRMGLHVLTLAALVAVAHNVATIIIVFRNAATGARQGAGGETGVCLSAVSDLSCFIAIGSPAVAAAIAITGFLLTYLTGRVEHLRLRARHRRTSLQLTPLWELLTEAIPHTAWTTGTSLSDRVIDIRDGLLLLAPYRRDEPAQAAAAAAEAAGLTGSHRAAVIEAAEIVAALREQGNDDQPPPQPPPTPDHATDALDTEADWLAQVADALSSPIVESFRTTTPAGGTR
ncbi:hypothetical protein BAY61_32160 (plasmid) [Prauserella marina]|uniref:DUF6545 domain-containing protein n=1 Tax=Prauserella marina TaxID=530584 RepID=A0A222W153_9PSEU|nr:MAB_1171c family putative transporter [Prauserella marina]ASR39938.1 hypothetical protein BAY61_32160 [Prauserella marina]PWV71441.1 hypothetical protein DES30_112157 [Prauserella marina]SDD97580.1 hypothetical protein SAMN05421630_115122 [Prauserella marina]